MRTPETGGSTCSAPRSSIEPDLLWQHICGKIDARTLLEFVCARLALLGGGAAVLDLAADGLGTDVMPVWERRRRRTIVLDNASAHVAKAFKGRCRQLAKIGVELFYLPPYSPELNDIELVWRQAKYEDYPQRAQTAPTPSARPSTRPCPSSETDSEHQQGTSPKPLRRTGCRRDGRGSRTDRPGRGVGGCGCG
ncbi:transposase [Streptomyces sp. NPDC021354]|uniref:transposase n=1 Tax=Streptomyces sp. NPDC021354 TaxID=3154793 RepID=UPI00340E297C